MGEGTRQQRVEKKKVRLVAYAMSKDGFESGVMALGGDAGKSVYMLINMIRTGREIKFRKSLYSERGHEKCQQRCGG